MSWNSEPDRGRTRPLVVKWDKPDGKKEQVSFPGGVDKVLVWLYEYCLKYAIEHGYQPKDGQCWGFADRVIAGTNQQSFHGIGGGRAIDFNAAENGRGSRGAIPMKVVEKFEKCGFTWGGRWDYPDDMHFEAREKARFYKKMEKKLKRKS